MKAAVNENVIIDTFLAGDGSISHVCKHLPISWVKVKKVIDSHNIQYKNPRKIIDAVLEKEIILLAQQNKSVSEIANTLGLKYFTVKSFCDKNNIKTRTGNSLDYTPYLEQVKTLAQQGKSNSYIAKQTNLSRGTVKNICKQFNIAVENHSAIPIKKEDILSTVTELGYQVISIEKKHNKTQVEALHIECGHIRNTSYWDYEKHACKHCSYTGTSKPEQEIKNWIQSLGFIVETKKIDRKEIDIYIPSLNLGIEYCGLYWHSEANGKGRYDHYDKMKLAEENNIRLITIFEDEWEQRETQVKNYLKSVLGIHDRKVFARKCGIKNISRIEAKKFLDENHIQGAANLDVAFGLFDKEDLLGVVTGHTHHRQGHKNTLVLNRLVFLDGVQVVGGASRLVKHLLAYAKLNGFIKLISWSDNRWSQGNVYRQCNFTLEEELKPDYSYTIGSKKRFSKQSCKKANLMKKGADSGLTEKEMALSLEYYRIWDCGKKRWTIGV